MDNTMDSDAGYFPLIGSGAIATAAMSNTLDHNSSNTTSTKCCNPKHNNGDEDSMLFTDDMSFLSPITIATPTKDVAAVPAVMMMPDSDILSLADENYDDTANIDRHNNGQRMIKKQRRNNTFFSSNATNTANPILQKKYNDSIARFDDINNNHNSTMIHPTALLSLSTARSNSNNINDCFSQHHHFTHRHQPRQQLQLKLANHLALRNQRRWRGNVKQRNKQQVDCNMDDNVDKRNGQSTERRTTTITGKQSPYGSLVPCTSQCDTSVNDAPAYNSAIISNNNNLMKIYTNQCMITNNFNWMEDGCNSSICTNDVNICYNDKYDNVIDDENMIRSNKKCKSFDEFNLDNKDDGETSIYDDWSNNENTKQHAFASFLRCMKESDNLNEVADFAECDDDDDSDFDGVTDDDADDDDLNKMDQRMKDLEEECMYLQLLQKRHLLQTRQSQIRKSSSGLDPPFVRDHQGKSNKKTYRAEDVKKPSVPSVTPKKAADDSNNDCVAAYSKNTFVASFPLKATSTSRRQTVEQGRIQQRQRELHQQLDSEMMNRVAYLPSEESLYPKSEKLMEDQYTILIQQQQKLSSHQNQVQSLKNQIDTLKQEVAIQEQQLLCLQMPQQKLDDPTIPSTIADTNPMAFHTKQMPHPQLQRKGVSLTHVSNETTGKKAPEKSDPNGIHRISPMHSQLVEKNEKSVTDLRNVIDYNMDESSENKPEINPENNPRSDLQIDTIKLSTDDTSNSRNNGDIESIDSTHSNAAVPPETQLTEFTSPCATQDGPIPMKTKRKKKPYVKRCKSFPVRFMDALICFEKDMEDVFTWLPDKKSFTILNQERFLQEIIQPPHFPITKYGAEKEQRQSDAAANTDGVCHHRTKFDSFVRKMNRWGYRRLGAGTGLDCFYHPLFRCDHPEWAKQIQQVLHQQQQWTNNTEIRSDSNDGVTSDDNPKTLSLRSSIGTSAEETFSESNGTESHHTDLPSLNGIEQFHKM